MNLNAKRIVILGGGIAGLAAAIALRGQGADVTVLEKAGAIEEVGAGLQISPNGTAVLRALGVAAQVAETASRATAVVLRDFRRGTPVMRLDLARHAPGAEYLLVHRADLIETLADAARAADVQIRLLQQVQEVVPGPPAQVQMRGGNTIQADLVIGADGLRSLAREALNGPAAPFFTGQVAWRAIVPNTFNLPAEAQVFMGPGRHLVAYPLRGGNLVNIVAVQERSGWQAEGWAHRDEPANLRAAFADFGGPARGLLEAVRDVGIWGLFRHPVAENWHAGHLALIGDAAHPTLPFLAQGANMALEDAWVLSECLREGTDIREALARYQEARRPRAERIVAAANGNAWKYHLRWPVRVPAHLVMRSLGAIAPGRMVSRFDWLYGHDVARGDWRG